MITNSPFLKGDRRDTRDLLAKEAGKQRRQTPALLAALANSGVSLALLGFT
jgi:hypothetical protein